MKAAELNDRNMIMEQAAAESTTDNKTESDDRPCSHEHHAAESLYFTDVVRHPLQKAALATRQTANLLAAARLKTRLLAAGLAISIILNILIPVLIIGILTRPEKVALMDGTQSLLIAPLVPAEQSREILETICYWAAKSLLDRGPQGLDAPDTLVRVFLPDAAKKATDEVHRNLEEFGKKSIHQKLEIARVDLTRLEDGKILAHVVGQLLTQAKVGDEQINQPQPVTLDMKLMRNPYLGRNQRYPFAVLDYAYGEPEKLTITSKESQ